MKPLMQKREIALFKKELLKQSKKNHIDVLEWGSGGSTIYFTDFLEEQKISYSWTSIEYNKAWYEKVKSVIFDKKNVHIELFDVGNNGLKQRYISMDEYVAYPKTLNKKFDIIFVDGRKRRRCVLLAKELLKEGGVVLLHDAQRFYYQCAFQEFENQHLIGPFFWRGSTQKISFKNKIFNIIIHYYFKVVFLSIIRPFQIVRSLAQKIYHRYAK